MKDCLLIELRTEELPPKSLAKLGIGREAVVIAPACDQQATLRQRGHRCAWQRQRKGITQRTRAQLRQHPHVLRALERVVRVERLAHARNVQRVSASVIVSIDSSTRSTAPLFTRASIS